MFQRRFPVDVREKGRIFREKHAVWAVDASFAGSARRSE
jgi:hypothetical protein